MNQTDFYLEEMIPVLTEVIASGGEFLLYPKGTSMLPLLVQGRDAVVLTSLPKDGPSRHDIVLYRRDDGHYVLHRIVASDDNGMLTMCGDNQSVWETGIRPEQCIAVVSRIQRKNRELPITSKRYRAYVSMHTKKLPRKTYFFFRAVKWKVKSLVSKSENC